VEEGEDEAEAKAEGEEETPPPFVADGDIVNYSVVGGQIGTIRQVASPIPTFDEGDSVVLYFVWKNEKWVVLNGERGKVDVVTEAGKEYVTSGSALAELGLLEVKKQPVSDATESAGPEGGTKIEATTCAALPPTSSNLIVLLRPVHGSTCAGRKCFNPCCPIGYTSTRLETRVAGGTHGGTTSTHAKWQALTLVGWNSFSHNGLFTPAQRYRPPRWAVCTVPIAQCPRLDSGSHAAQYFDTPDIRMD
jgi:hypothetical protein